MSDEQPNILASWQIGRGARLIEGGMLSISSYDLVKTFPEGDLRHR